MVASCAVIALTSSNLPGLDSLLVAFLVLKESSLKIDEEIKPFISARMKNVLLNHSLPDRVEIVEQLPINDHGTTDCNNCMLLLCVRL